MALPEFSMRQLLESGAHFGHRQQRWNPKMAPFIYGSRNDIHILDLTQTVPLLHQALVALRDVAAGGGRILFVGTKRQASDPIASAAKRCAQYYVNHRWLGGTLTNWQTISNSIKRMRNIEETLSSAQSSGLKKKELLDKTGAGMMDCKAALADTNGDMEAAIDWLRKKGISKAAKKAGRAAVEGLVGVAVDAGTGVLLEVNAETDFVARNDEFKTFVKDASRLALKEGGDLE